MQFTWARFRWISIRKLGCYSAAEIGLYFASGWQELAVHLSDSCVFRSALAPTFLHSDNIQQDAATPSNTIYSIRRDFFGAYDDGQRWTSVRHQRYKSDRSHGAHSVAVWITEFTVTTIVEITTRKYPCLWLSVNQENLPINDYFVK